MAKGQIRPDTNTLVPRSPKMTGIETVTQPSNTESTGSVSRGSFRPKIPFLSRESNSRPPSPRPSPSHGRQERQWLRWPPRNPLAENTTSDLYTNGRSEQHPPQPPSAALATSRDTAGDVEQDMDPGAQYGALTNSKFQQRDGAEMRANISNATQLTVPSSQPPHSGMTQYQENESAAVAKIAEPTVTSAGTVQQDLSASVPDDPSHSQSTPPNEKLTPITVPPDDDVSQRKSANSGDPKQTTRESEEIEKLRRELSESRSQIAELQNRLEAQSSDLKGLSDVFDTADNSSDSDIIRACQRLNAELQQDTTYMSEYLVQNFEFRNSTTDPTEDQMSAARRTSDHVGLRLAKSLSTQNTDEVIPLLLQFAFQAYLASTLSSAASSWTLSEPRTNEFIFKMYEKLRSVEAQAISGHWRALARAHSRNTLLEPFVERILTDLSDILAAAGCTAAQSNIISVVTSKFKQKIFSLVELAAGLGKKFDEVISSDFEAFIACSDDKFDDETMEDTDGDQVGNKEETVLCSTHLGLIKRLPIGTSLWEKGEKQKIVVLKCKVLLESSLDMNF